MNKRTQVRLAFAGLGLAVTAVMYASGVWIGHYSGHSKLAEISLELFSLIVCPPSLLSATVLDLDPYTAYGARFWLAIGLLNSALWERIGAVVGRAFWKQEGSTTC